MYPASTKTTGMMSVSLFVQENIEKIGTVVTTAKSTWNRAHIAVKLALGVTGGCLSWLLLRFFYLKTRRIVKRLPPGPVGVPFFGSVFMMQRMGVRKVFLELFQTYGDICMYPIGISESIMINDPSLAIKVFKTRKNEIDTTVHSYDHGLEWNESNQHRNHFGLNFKAIQSFRALLGEEALNSKFIKQGIERGLNLLVFPQIDNAIKEKKSIENIQSLVKPMTFSLMMFAVFGVKLNNVLEYPCTIVKQNHNPVLYV